MCHSSEFRAGNKRDGSSSSMMEFIHETQHHRPSLKKQRLGYKMKHQSFSSSSSQHGFLKETGDAITTHDEQQRSKMGSVFDGGEKKRGCVGFSDSKTARVEMLKKRFGRIIVKAAEFQVEDRSGKKVDSVEMQRKNQILEKKLQEAEIAAEAAIKMELQRKREAARKALLELEKSSTVEIDDNVKTMKDFATLLGYPQNCAACVTNEAGWYGLCFSNTCRTSDWRKR